MGPIQGQINNLLAHTAGLSTLAKIKDNTDKANELAKESNSIEKEKLSMEKESLSQNKTLEIPKENKVPLQPTSPTVYTGDNMKKTFGNDAIKTYPYWNKDLTESDNYTTDELDALSQQNEMMKQYTASTLASLKAKFGLNNVRQAKMNQVENSRVSELKKQPIIPLSKLHSEEDYFKLDEKSLEGRISSQDIINSKAEQKENSITSEDKFKKDILKKSENMKTLGSNYNLMIDKIFDKNAKRNKDEKYFTWSDDESYLKESDEKFLKADELAKLDGFENLEDLYNKLGGAGGSAVDTIMSYIEGKPLDDFMLAGFEKYLPKLYKKIVNKNDEEGGK